jgi:hypothetical protein
MPRAWTRPGGTGWLALAVLLAGAVLAGCDPGVPDRPPPLPAAPSPGPADPMPGLAERCGPRPPDAEQPPEAWAQFYVTPQQFEVISARLFRVLCDQGLWRKGAGFGTNVDPQGKRFVMIHPGHTGLTARQILDRYLGRGP